MIIFHFCSTPSKTLKWPFVILLVQLIAHLIVILISTNGCTYSALVSVSLYFLCGRKVWLKAIEDMKSKLRVLFREDHSISLPTKSAVEQCCDCAAHAILTKGETNSFSCTNLSCRWNMCSCACAVPCHRTPVGKKLQKKGVKTCIFLLTRGKGTS